MATPKEGNLADLVVQFSAEGATEILELTKELKKAFDDLYHELEDLAAKEDAALKKNQDNLAKFGQLAQGVFAAASASILGFVTAGMSGTAQSQQLTFQMAELSRTIAGIFGPEIQGFIDIIRDLTNWLRSLSDAQLESIAYWAKFAFAFGTIIFLAPKIVSAIRTIIAGIQALTKAQIISLAFQGPKGWAILAAGAVIAGVAVGAGHAFGAFGEEGGKKSRRSLAQSVSGFESVEASYNRVAQSALSGSASLPEQHLEELKKHTDELQKLNKTTENKPPVVDRRN